jgi:hypothetical protein
MLLAATESPPIVPLVTTAFPDAAGAAPPMLWNTFTDEAVKLLTATDRFDCAELPTFTNMIHSFVGAEAESVEAYACRLE